MIAGNIGIRTVLVGTRPCGNQVCGHLQILQELSSHAKMEAWGDVPKQTSGHDTQANTANLLYTDSRPSPSLLKKIGQITQNL